ncbi:protein bicaudal C homolog 1-B-like [Ischnura elegans]|uniref:protein bicaudal C homolog 1-B-like n=1 Tax=Ischnura elegans TaxID=197161 RepID=UPI001ED8B1D5|nr:protein bicaudal C homolog 1-B-like [Ischnura elegans]
MENSTGGSMFFRGGYRSDHPKLAMNEEQEQIVETDSNCNSNYSTALADERPHDGGIESQEWTSPKYEDRFLVDRRKLELLLLGALDCANYADDFFNIIMDTTKTAIDWPRRLKIGAKTRKDPYVRISGKPSDVKRAKEKVLAVLDPKGSHTIMKLDICYTDHSHIIGKGGQTIQRVKEETGCHIHFPDSNRSNINEKSNQVSIAGEIEGVEKARQQLRMLTPVKFSFELPAMSPVNIAPHPVSQIIATVQEKYNVHIILKKGPRLFSNVILVKGSEAELLKTETATRVLMQHLCDSSEGEVPVQMTMEISPHHHSIVRGVNSCNLKAIMMQTSTVIIFPDAADPNLPPIKKSTVAISGSIHNVYLAKQRLVGSLPLVLRFDVWEEEHLGIERCNKIMQLLDVKISALFKPKYGTYSVCVKGLERNAGNLYKARQLLLNSSEPAIQANIPQAYLGVDPFQNPTDLSLQKILEDGPLPSESPHNVNPASSLSNDSSREIPSDQAKSHTSTVASQMGEGLNAAVGLDSESVLSDTEDAKNSSFGSGLLHLLPAKSSQSKYSGKEGGDISPASSSMSTLSSPSGRQLHSSRSICFQGTDSGYAETCDSESSRPVSGFSMAEPWHQEVRIRSEAFKKINYESVKPLAVKAMQDQPDSAKLRVPNSVWSGFGFSHTMPASVLKACTGQAELESPKNPGGQAWCEQPYFPLTYDLCRSTVPVNSPSMTMDAAMASISLKGNTNDIIFLLESIGLERYSYLFTSEELDMETFMTLDDNDLRELGVSTYNARMKILRTIAELRKSYFSDDSATGAEYKAGTSSQWGRFGF